MSLRRAMPLGFVLLLACVGTTGYQLVDFPAAAAGTADVTSPLSFDETTTSGHTWHVVLTHAKLHVGAVYLDQAQPVSGSQSTSCILPGVYAAEVLTGVNVDLLSPTPQPFPVRGHGTTLPALVGQVWLTGGDVNTIEDSTPILVVAGTASDDAGAVVPFEGTITISSNRPGSAICKQRIVTPILTNTSVQTTGGLLLRVDARRLFVNVDFSELPRTLGTGEISDDPTSPDYTQPSINVYDNLRGAGTYSFEWSEALR